MQIRCQIYDMNNTSFSSASHKQARFISTRTVAYVRNFEYTRRWESCRVSNLQSCWNGIGHKRGNLLFTYHQSICHSDAVCKQMLVNKSQRHFSTFTRTRLFHRMINRRAIPARWTDLLYTKHCCTWEIIDEVVLNYWKLMHSTSHYYCIAALGRR